MNEILSEYRRLKERSSKNSNFDGEKISIPMGWLSIG